MIPSSVRASLICLRCGSLHLEQRGESQLHCSDCDFCYPVVRGIPILIDERRSVFTIADFAEERNLFFDISSKGRRIRSIADTLPTLESQRVSEGNFRKLASLLLQRSERPRVLVLGGSIEGAGIRALLDSPQIELVESDVSFGPRTQIILDAHAIPYSDSSFDCVVAQAVLEHVIDPFVCVSEIYRVLNESGLVYVELPFMQQVHGQQYDFLRFTASGLRRLFRHFEEIDAGMTAGPGSALAWSYQYLLLSLFGFSPAACLVVKAAARLTGFWLKYLDALADRNPYAVDAACGLYFLGRKSALALDDRQIIEYYFQKHNSRPPEAMGSK